MLRSVDAYRIMEAESASRSDSVSKLWRKVYEELNLIDPFIFSTTLNLVQEAAGCHKSGLYVASMVMCRGALESMLHTLKSWRKEGARYYLGQVTREGLPSLIRWAVGNSVMTSRQANVANHVKEMGDLSAHIAQRIDIQRCKYASYKRYRVWGSERESWKLLKQTAKLLSTLANNRRMKLTKRSSARQIPCGTPGL